MEEEKMVERYWTIGEKDLVRKISMATEIKDTVEYSILLYVSFFYHFL